MSATNYHKLGEIEMLNETPVPFPAAIFVALFLILITFFILISQDANIAQKRDADAFKSIKEKFGKPDDQMKSFSQAVKPRFSDYALELEQIFGVDAKIESTTNGDRATITADKEFYFYPDETNFKPERSELIAKLQAVLVKWQNNEHPKFTFNIGMTDYAADKLRLNTFAALVGGKPDLAINTNNGTKVTIVIEDVQ